MTGHGPSASRPPAPAWAWWIATGFGSGRLKPAPGTWGSLAALGAWLLMEALVALPFASWTLRNPGAPRLFLGYGALEVRTPFSGLSLGTAAGPALAWGYWGLELLFLAVPIALVWLGVKASDRVLAATGEKDPGYIVVDEWAGLWVALWPLRWAVPLALAGPGWKGALILVAAPFLLFRLFDIWKPWPIRQLQDLPDGEGVVADDAVAGLLALVLTQALMPVLARLAG